MTHHSIIMLTKKVIAALAKSKSTVKEEADKIMGGQVLDYETKVIFREGIQQGIEQGFENGLESGKIIARFEDGMPIEEIAERTNVSVETVKSILTKGGLI
jgi:flagellar biosynthesis/type III secretory pathway protein FliH